MNNTEIHRTDLDRQLAVELGDSWRTLLAGAALIILWVSFRPFQGGQPVLYQGSLLNQLGYTATTGLLLLTLVTSVRPAILLRLASPGWALLIVWILISGYIISPGGGEASRGATFSVITVVMAATIVAIAPTERRLTAALVGAGGLVMIASYGGLLLNPLAAVHQAFEVEAQHVGLWRGVFVHKNVAGPAVAMIVFVAIFAIRRGWQISGWLLLAASALFVFQSGSKTTIALLPVVVGLVLLPQWLGLRVLVPIAGLAMIIGAHALTVGTVFSPVLDSVLRVFDPLTTYTGRVEIWEFAKNHIWTHPLTGFGYDGFWGTPIVTTAEQPFDTAWDPRGIGHGHNGFLDAWLFYGVVGFALIAWLTVISPALQYLATPDTAANRHLADLFYMMAVFAALNCSLESFFFNRIDAVWLSMVFALFGLRLVSRFRVTA
ncbi:MAG: O-antigen ligase [Pseudomonadota bacterium]